LNVFYPGFPGTILSEFLLSKVKLIDFFEDSKEKVLQTGKKLSPSER